MVFPAFTSVSRYTHLRQDNVGEEVSRYLLESSAQRLLLDMIFSLKTKNTTMASGKMRIDSMGRLLLETIEQGLATRIGRVPQGHSNGKRYCAETDSNPYFGIDVHSFTDISRITLWFSAQINSSFSRDRGPHELFCTSLCACRCPGASDPGPGRGHGPSHGHVRAVRADRSSGQRSSGLPPQQNATFTDQRRLDSGCTVANPSPCTYSSAGEIAGFANSTYNALQTSLQKRFSHGLSFL